MSAYSNRMSLLDSEKTTSNVTVAAESLWHKKLLTFLHSTTNWRFGADPTTAQ